MLPTSSRRSQRPIIATLRIRLGSAKSDGRTPAVYNPAAYQLYLKGRGQWNQRTESGMREALESFQQAVALDAQFAAAYAGIADAYALLAEYGIATTCPSDGTGPGCSRARARA